MDRIKTIICIFILIFSSTISAEQTDEFKKLLEDYKSQYKFYSIKDTMYRIQTEFELPDGFSYIELKNDSSFPYWVSNFPIWHQFKAVGHWKGNKVFEHDEVSRVIHLPWQGPTFKDVAIPIRILGEYEFQFNNRFDFQVMPKKGEMLTYQKWLNGKAAYNHRGEVLFKDDIVKEDTENEYYLYMLFCMQNINFESVAKSCDTVALNAVQAGDMFIGYDKTGNKGKLLIIFRLISNESGDIMYLVANGCPEACDLYIPKINNDRDIPWITFEQLQKLTEEYDNSRFYRFKTTVNNNIE